jgi:ribulose 1,5-bisphosphate synthetase/thiazole synthase
MEKNYGINLTGAAWPDHKPTRLLFMDKGGGKAMDQHYDVLVIGGGLAGVAAAATAAAAGKRTLLAESRTFLGGSWAASLRYWVPEADYAALQEELDLPGDTVLATKDGECGLVPVRIKIALEDYLLKRGVTLLYAARPLQWSKSTVYQVDFAGKFGIQAFTADQVIDASEQGVLLRCTPRYSNRYEGKEFIARRVLEMTGVAQTVIAEPGVGNAADIQVHQGKADLGHVRLEQFISCNDDIYAPLAVNQLEIETRGTTRNLFRWLLSDKPGYEKAKLTQISQELFLPALIRMNPNGLGDSWGGSGNARASASASPSPGSSPSPSSGSSSGSSPSSGPGSDSSPGSSPSPSPSPSSGSSSGSSPSSGSNLEASQFRMFEGVWLASGAANIGEAEAEALSLDPLKLLRLGQRIGNWAISALAHNSLAAEVQGNNNMAAIAGTEVYRMPSVAIKTEVLVIGGGTSGTPAAIAAARSGASTLLAEMNYGLGGTGTVGGVDSYWFGRREGFTKEIVDLVAEEHASVNMSWKGVTAEKWNIEARMHALLKAVLGSGSSLLLYAVLAEIKTDSNSVVTGAVFVTPYEQVTVECGVVVDATGDGDAAMLAGAEFVYGSEREGVTMWYSMVPEVKPGVNRNNFTSNVEVGDAFDYTRALLAARRRYAEYDHKAYIAPRESRHIVGEAKLTLTDQLSQRHWPDVINIAFSNHDIKGHSTSDWIRMGLIPPNLEIEIPYRVLLPIRIDGLLVAGKAISGTHDALPAVRMQADLENLGAVCGIAAAMSIQLGCTPRNLPVHKLQKTLLDWKILRADSVLRELEVTVEGSRDEEILQEGQQAQRTFDEGELRAWIELLDDEQKLYDYADMGFLDIFRGDIPIVKVCTAGARIIPLLKEELARPNSPRLLSVARALAWYGEGDAVPVIVENMEPFFAEEELPPRRIKVKHVQAPPDQGAMPELAYLLYTLGMARDGRAVKILERAQSKLKPSWEKLIDGRHGMFYYVDSLCYIAERLGSPDCVPILRKMLDDPLFKGRSSTAAFQSDFFEERAAYLELVIARAVARCGGAYGLKVLTGYLSDSRRLLAQHAHRELQSITGWTLAPEAALWLERIGRVEGHMVSKPWLEACGMS